MDVKNLPEDLTRLSPDELTDAQTSIAARAEEIAAAEELSDADIEEIGALADAGDAVKGEITRRAEAKAAQAEKLNAAMGRIKGEGAPADDDPAADADAGAEMPVPVAAAVSGSKTEQLAARRPSAAKPKAAERAEFMRSSGNAVGVSEGHVFASVSDVAHAIAKTRHGFGSIEAGEAKRLSIATGSKSGFAGELTGDAIKNFAVLRGVQLNAQALVASGETCFPPLTPLVEFFRLAEAQTPLEDDLQVVQAPKGGIRYLVSPDTTTALAAARNAFDVSAPDRDYAGATVRNTSGPKAYATVSCPTVAEENVEAISTRIRFDNLQYRVFPEQVEAFLEDVAVEFASKKEVYYLDYIDSKSTAVTSDFGYGISRGLLADWTLAAAGYRKRHGMKRDAMLKVLAMDYSIDMIKLDLALQQNGNADFWTISDEQAIAALKARNLAPVWLNDPATAKSSQKWNQAQAVGALNVFPTQLSAYFYAPGTFVRLDGGTLDVGLVRDSTLNGTNDLELFNEEWLGMAMLGFESVRLTSTVAVNGYGPLELVTDANS